MKPFCRTLDTKDMEDLQAGHQLVKDNMEIMTTIINMVDRINTEETTKMEETIMHMETTIKAGMLNF